ncbi:MAG: HEAT repeat domain-containing protein, partial [Planctomycetota bacterium]
RDGNVRRIAAEALGRTGPAAAAAAVPALIRTLKDPQENVRASVESALVRIVCAGAPPMPWGEWASRQAGPCRLWARR